MKRKRRKELIERYRIEEFLIEQQLAKATWVGYRSILASVFDWLGDRNVQEVEPAEFYAWFDEKGWGESMRWNARAALKSFLMWRDGDIGKLARLKIRRHKPGPQRTLSPEELETVKAYLKTRRDTKGVRDLCIFSLLLDTGLRASEVCRLRWSDIDMQDLSLAVRIKGGNRAKAIFSETTARRLQLWHAARYSWESEKGTKFRGGESDDMLDRWAETISSTRGWAEDRVFVGIGGNTPGRPLTRGGLRHICQKIAKRAGVETFGPHALRRTMACEMLRRGASTRMVQLAGRWTDLEMVSQYSQLLEVEAGRQYQPLA